MNFNIYYKDEKRSSVNLEKILNNTKKGIIKRLNNKVTQKECQQLQTFFNEVFYPKNSEKSSTYYDEVMEIIGKAYEKKFNKTLDNFKIGDVDSYFKAEPKDLKPMIQEKYEHFNHKEKIQISTVKQRLLKVKEAIKNIDLRGTQELQKLKKDLEELQRGLEELTKLKTSGEGDNAYLNLKNDKDLFEKVKMLDAQFQALSQPIATFTPEDYGQILEWILESFNYQSEVLSDNIADTLLDIFTEKKTAGSQYMKEEKTFSFNSNVQYDNFIKKEKEVIKKDNGKTEEVDMISLDDGNFKFRYTSKFNPYSKRPGKMDVQLTLNLDGKNKDFRISAKNWQNLDRNFGNTSLANALIRSIGKNNTDKYIYTMQDEYNKDIVKRGHEVAKYAILADILMGYSQQNNYADTILINDRSHQTVIVFSILDLMEKIYEKISDIKVAEYEEDLINNKLIILRQAVQKQKSKHDQTYKTLAYMYMHSLQVSIHFKNIQDYIPQNLTK